MSQAVAEHREHRVRPPEPVSVRLARGDGVAFADQGGEALLHRGPLLGRAAAGTAEGTPAPAGSSISGDALKFGKTPAQRARAGLRAAEDAGEGVVVALGDRVHLVVVAAGAGDREPEEGARGRLDLLVDDVQHELPAVLGVVGLAAEGEEAGRDELIGPLAVVLGGQQVAGDLLADELVVRLVGVERGDHPVAIAPGLGIGEVRLAARLGEPRHVEPVPAPALAEAGRGEQPIDDLGEGVGRVVREEGVDLLGRGRQADEVERHPAEEPRSVGVGDRGEPAGLERREEEAVDLAARPVRPLHGRRQRTSSAAGTTRTPAPSRDRPGDAPRRRPARSWGRARPS